MPLMQLNFRALWDIHSRHENHGVAGTSGNRVRPDVAGDAGGRCHLGSRTQEAGLADSSYREDYRTIAHATAPGI